MKTGSQRFTSTAPACCSLTVAARLVFNLIGSDHHTEGWELTTADGKHQMQKLFDL